MKILVIHNHYQQAGGEKVAVEAQTALLRQHGHQVVLYAKQNTSIAEYGVVRRALFFPRTVFSRHCYREILDLVRRERPDVAHLHNVFPLISPAAYVALRVAGVPIVQTVHNFRLLCPNALFYTHGRICELCKGGQTMHAVRLRCFHDSYALSALYALTIGMHRRVGTFARIARFIALTDFSAAKLIEGGLATQDEISVLGNFLPDPLPGVGSFHGRSPYVVCLGRLSPEKGVATLVEAAARVPDIDVKIMGDGPEGGALRELARLRHATNVEFLGQTTGDAKWKFLRQALAVVIPSLCYEQFPFALLEGMAAGTPILASRLGSLENLVDDGRNGLLFRAEDSQDLAEKLRLLRRDPQATATMGQCARRTVESRWSAEVHHDRLMKIYELALRPGNATPASEARRR
jgi:glycosyltransferase involved in cell wall biosynthesis